ncbi:hypothetical protein H4J50_13820 [Colwellia sp. 6M3]|jgi:hypothetical protein|uniref:hypothetical protein n=1 Tax=Colwellia sp. 6M3 TaxID=2759849 RepID=UPI0015F606CF|nr:hypothetical protein [Colwellia sp. 6M3]MBA6417095.1 hypothetical protein [Colwellia sp. 6M3]
MSKYLTGDTNFTAKVKILLSKIYGRSPLKDSVLERAISYFELEALSQRKLDKLNNEITRLVSVGSDKSKNKLTNLKREQRDYLQVLRQQSNERAQQLQLVCRDIIELCEGETRADTNKKSAELLGTIQLLSPTEGSKVASVNERSKPLYRGVLTLRLLDQICLKTLSSGAYLTQELAKISEYDYQDLRNENEAAYLEFVDHVKIPMLMAAILQDIGNYHPDAQMIMQGSDGKKSVFRALNVEERKALLQINYRETMKYLVNGIGVVMYLGNSKEERNTFNKVETNKLRFVKQLLKGSIQPKLGVGNILKIPQIYTAIVLSTKDNYNYKLLPKVYQALYQNAERGNCCRGVVDSLYKITGDFPQGFGVIYIPKDSDQNVRYEYAIVTQLYPEKSNEPICRIATRQLAFIGHGHDLVVKKTNNLYFVETAKEFSSINKERLNEILELLSSNYLERKKLDLLPRCWQPEEFFTQKINQKLWNRMNYN